MKRLLLAVLVLLFASEAQACWRVRCCRPRVRVHRVIKAPVRVVHRAIEVIPTPPPTCSGGACKTK